MLCPQCDTELPAENRFCEECGAALPNSEANAAAELSLAGADADGCTKCGAPGESIDAEGYCAECGFRRGKPSRDHFEVTISARFAGVCDRGLRHSRNEDFFCLAQTESGKTVMVVCDGVSSSRSAEEASQAAAECASKILAAPLPEAAPGNAEAAAEALRQAQQAVLQIDLASAGRQDDPATTLVLALVEGQHATIAWVGDSRAYWIAPGDNKQLTRDHSWINEFAGSGNEKPNSAQMHAITRWLGRGAPDDEPSIVDFEIPGPGKLLLCTDGLWNYAPETGSLAALVEAAQGGAVDIARELVNFARAQGGVDNITAAVLTFEPETETPTGEN
jgi:serine/threonine protein phosphatase PrpC